MIIILWNRCFIVLLHFLKNIYTIQIDIYSIWLFVSAAECSTDKVRARVDPWKQQLSSPWGWRSRVNSLRSAGWSRSGVTTLGYKWSLALVPVFDSCGFTHALNRFCPSCSSVGTFRDPHAKSTNHRSVQKSNSSSTSFKADYYYGEKANKQQQYFFLWNSENKSLNCEI